MFPFSSILTATPDETVQLVSKANCISFQIQPNEALVIVSISAVDAGNGRKRAFVQWDGIKTGDAIAYQDINQWVIPEDFLGDYWVRASYTGDAPFDGDAFNVWLPLVKDVNQRSWFWVNGNAQPDNATLTLELATDDAGASIVATADYGITLLSDF